MRTTPLLSVIAGAGAAWMLHLCLGYFLIALGCSRQWPVGRLLAVVTVACAAVAVCIGFAALARRARSTRVRDDVGVAETTDLLLAVGALLAGLFGMLIVMGGLVIVALPPCQDAVGGLG